MAGSNNIVGSFTVDKHFLNPFSAFLQHGNAIQHQNKLLPIELFPYRKRRLHLRKVLSTPVAFPTNEHLMKTEEAEPVTINVTALVTVRKNNKQLQEAMLHCWDAFTHPTQRSVVLQLISTEIDPNTMEPKLSNEAELYWSRIPKIGANQVTYRVKLVVDSNFGMPGAIKVSNNYLKEFFLESITIEGLVHFACNSWIQPHIVHKEKRIFFSSKAYLPSETPTGLKELREKESRELRGDGKGVRKLSDRIYDYDVYNDLGYPDMGLAHVRPIVGGERNPHPRRCRTGRPPTITDANAESPVNASMPMYVPRDETFEEPKQAVFLAGKLKAVLRNMIPYLVASISAKNDCFKDFSEIDNLFNGRLLGDKGYRDEFPKNIRFSKFLNRIRNSIDDPFKFESPTRICRDTFCWLRDDEFGRQMIAGTNPVNIERVKDFPPVSRLEASIYGPQMSALKEEHIRSHLEGKSVQQAIDENKLFILDFHDIYLPFINKINAPSGRKAYATRTLFFLTQAGTLKPIAIELSLPPSGPSPQSKQVLTPPIDATTNWLWQLGKSHVCSNDASIHQLVNHWLRTHACIEPFIIAAHRQLSTMHPIFKLLHPHMRYTMHINALARESLLNAGGILEFIFTPGKYSMDLVCAAYRDQWRFDLEGLPADLIRRGVAIPDPTKAHGLRLLIEDYPYATDGLLIWSAIETWVQTYVNHYYPIPHLVLYDTELQAWYHESINVGHADLRHASWWPRLSSPGDLISILTTIIWLASAQHAAINFGQYSYGGYVPTRPPLMRLLVPKENDPEYTDFVNDPKKYYLSSLPSLFQTTQFMAIIDMLSTHSPDEEYLGERQDLSIWSGDTIITEAYYRFSMDIKQIEKEIQKRNIDRRNKNRCGAGVSSYELLIPSSGAGITSRGVPNSISI